MTRKPRSHVRILIYRMWAITVIETFKIFMSYVVSGKKEKRRHQMSSFWTPPYWQTSRCFSFIWHIMSIIKSWYKFCSFCCCCCCCCCCFCSFFALNFNEKQYYLWLSVWGLSTLGMRSFRSVHSIIFILGYCYSWHYNKVWRINLTWTKPKTLNR